MSSVAEHRELAAEIELLYTAYAETLDNGEIRGWPSFFARECLYRITTRENLDRRMPLCFVLCDGHAMLRDRAVSLQRTVVFRQRFQRRMLSGLRLKTFHGLDGNGIETCASFAIFESVGDDPSRLLVCGRSSDVIVRERNELKFKERLCVIDARVIPDSLVFPI